MAAFPRMTLTYFPSGARAEPLRIVATIGKIPFFHIVVEFKEWEGVKMSLKLPVLEIEYESGDKDVITQSTGILRYFGKVGGLLPDDPIASLTSTAEDAALPLDKSVPGPVRMMIADELWSKEQLLEIRKRILTDGRYGLPFYLSYFEMVLQDNGTGWLVGEQITIADLQFHRNDTWIESGCLTVFRPPFWTGSKVKRIRSLSTVC